MINGACSLLFIMKNSFGLDSEWEFEPSFGANGDMFFDGLPCPTKKALARLGENGIADIDHMLKTMKKWQEIMYGENDDLGRVGFSEQEYFTNSKGESVKCSCTAPGLWRDELKDKYAYPERRAIENYEIEFYERVNEVLSEEPKK